MIATVSAQTLLATLGLLALATSASAEGAWVLWFAVGETRDGQTFRGPWEPHSGAETLAKCQNAILQSMAAKDAPHNEKGWIEMREVSDGSTYLRDLSRPGSGTYFKCLPDTVDPRGPKGK